MTDKRNVMLEMLSSNLFLVDKSVDKVLAFCEAVVPFVIFMDEAIYCT